ncbi:MAG: hypothetical protein NTY38_25405 [Acidobacteria bacterium]|nr:hypothetical protein [Acidobacteriota bacterium]
MSFLHRRQFLQRATAALALPTLAQAQPAKPKIRSLPIEFGSGKMVFCDWWFVEAGYGLAFTEQRQQETRNGPLFMPRGVRLRAGRPTLTPGPVIRPDRPTDGVTMGGYCTLLKDGGKYRLWYESYLPLHGKDEEANICYAESDNGFDWKKPAAGIIEYGGSKNNNLVYSRGHGASIFIDPTARPAERYKMLHLDRVPLQEHNGKQWEAFLFGAVSPDGIHWTRLPEPIIKHTSDTQSVAEYDPVKRRYVAYLRGWEPQTDAGYGGRRIVVRTESPEFGNFPDPVPVLSMGPQDPPDADIYTNAFQRWPGASRAYLMTPAIYHRASDRVDLQLAVSHDGVRWQFPQPEPFLANGEAGSGYEGSMYAGRGTVALGNGNWAFPVSGYQNTHNMYFHPTPERPSQGGVWLASLREDGYMAVEAGTEGEFWTQPASFTGSRLLLNCWGLLGSRVRVEFTDRFGKPLPGFSLAECDGLAGEHLWSPVSWLGKSDVSALSGQPLRVHFHLNRVRLHGFQFA